MELIEQVRNYWDHRPCNIRHSPKPVGSKEYFEEVEKRKYLVEPHIPGFAQFHKWKGKKVLEIGCGIGTDSINFAKAGAHLTIVDLSTVSLELCKQRFATYGLTADFFLGNAEEISRFLPKTKFDLIYSFGVIHHSPHPDRVLHEIKSYCHSGTELRVMLYSKWSWKVFWIVMKYGRGAIWRGSELVKRYSEAEIGSPVTYCYSFRDLKKLFHEYRIVGLEKAHIFPYKIEKYKNYEYEKVWYFRMMPTALFQYLERKFGWHTLITAKPLTDHRE